MADVHQTYAAFWPYYLTEHAKADTRALHFAGTALALLLLLGAVVYGSWWLLLAAVVAGYAFAWVGHFFIENNRPATFTYPVWSLASDFRMFLLWCAGRLEGELRRAGVQT
jgi:hypothetical protein